MKKILLIGRTGVGKSSFINATFGSYKAETSKYEPCTKTVNHYILNTFLDDVYLIDTPGLADSSEEVDLAYLKLIKENIDIESLYAFFYITRLDESRFRSDEMQTLNALNHAFGPAIWPKTVLIFTFAANVNPEELTVYYQTRFRHFRNHITTLVPHFNRFLDCWMTDNKTTDWSQDLIPINDAINKLPI